MKMEKTIAHITCIAWLLLSTIAEAQTTTVPVRAGEHSDFTRVVIPIPEERTWRVDTFPMSTLIYIDGPEINFDLSQTFLRIPRTRLKQISRQDNALIFDLACDCTVTAAEDIPGFLVLDISYSVSATSSSVDKPVTRPRLRPALNYADGDKTLQTASRVGAALAQTVRLPESSRPGIVHPLERHLKDLRHNDNVLLDPALDENERPQVEEPSNFSVELARILSQSVSAGRLSPSEHPDTNVDSDSVMPIARSDSISASSHIDLGFEDRTLGAAPVDTKLCSDLQPFSLIRDYSEEYPFAWEGSLLGLFGERDLIGGANASRAVTSMLQSGFGVEARMILSLMDIPAAVKDIVEAKSYIVDQQSPPSRDVFSTALTCGGEYFLWHFLNSGGTDNFDEDFMNKMILIFDELPKATRTNIGPDLVRVLLKNDDDQRAVKIQESIERVASVEDPRVELSRTLINFSDASNNLERLPVAADTSDDILLLTLHESDLNGGLTSDEILQAGDDRIALLRGSIQKIELIRLLGRAYARNGSFSKAFNLAERLSRAAENQQQDSIDDYIFERLLMVEDDRVFVDYTFQETPWSNATISGDTRIQLAERLSSLGFDDQANLLRGRSDSGPVQRTSHDAAERLPDRSMNENVSSMTHSRLTTPGGESRDLRYLESNHLREPGGEASGEDFSDGGVGLSINDTAPSVSAPVAQNDSMHASEARGEVTNTSPVATAELSAGLLRVSHDALEESASMRDRLKSLLPPN